MKIENRKARFEYTILDTYICGIVLFGSEVKSLNQRKKSNKVNYKRAIKKPRQPAGLHF